MKNGRKSDMVKSSEVRHCEAPLSNLTIKGKKAVHEIGQDCFLPRIDGQIQ